LHGGKGFFHKLRQNFLIHISEFLDIEAGAANRVLAQLRQQRRLP
jgi:hypothetical protein